MATLPQLPKGTRDFEPATLLKRNYIIGAIRKIFIKFGFLPLETPSMENLSVLMGKYGEEGDRLLFKIVNSGDFLKKASDDDKQSSQKLLPKISEKGLRYDLTVPFARFVAANQSEIAFPFKRYQIQPVWRADRPQKGRYREFYQCDADVVGTKSLICEMEIIQMIREVFEKLNIEDYTIKISHREIIRGISEFLGYPGRETDLSVAMDKLDKIGKDGVRKELETKDFSADSIEKLFMVLDLKGQTAELLNGIKSLINNEAASNGAEDLLTILQMLVNSGENHEHIEIDPSLARGLSYYTGAIFEVKINNVSIGSVSGGGRYDNLTGVFGVKDVPGVGFSFGIDRLYDSMLELGLFPDKLSESTKCLIVHFDEHCQQYGLKILRQFRENGIATELYPDLAKMKKQMTYADKKSIPFVLFVGSNEIESGMFKLKNMADGSEQHQHLTDLIKILKA